MTDPATPPSPDSLDPAKLRGAHGRTGQMFQSAGLPFDEDEFDDEVNASAKANEDAAVLPTDEGAGD